MDMEVGETAPARLAGAASWLLGQTALHAGRLVNAVFAAVDARGYHYRVLATLAEFGPDSQAGLGRHCGIHLSDLVATINELAAQGYVERATDPADRRRNIITITPAGLDRLTELDEQLDRIQDEVLAPLTPDERAELTRLLSRLLEYHAR